MDARLEREAGRGGVFRFGRETVEIADVRVDGVDGGPPAGGRGQQHRRPGVQGDAAVPPVGKPARPAAQRRDQVLGAPHQRDHVGRGGQFRGGQDPLRCLAQRHDLPPCQRVQLVAALRLRQHDHPVCRAMQRFEVRGVFRRARGVDPHDDTRGVNCRRDEGRARRFLPGGANAVL